MWFTNKHYEDVIGILEGLNRDLRDQLDMERQQWAQERSQLVDRVIALADPASLREFRMDKIANRPREIPLTAKVQAVYPPDINYSRPIVKPKWATHHEEAAKEIAKTMVSLGAAASE
jgi:ABC-type phosphate transport system auxiliary subunit